MLLLLLACAGTPDTGAPPVDTAGAWPCVGEPVVTYPNWGEGFLAAYCDACHAASAPDRHGAPVGVTFDTEEELAEQAERVRARVFDTADMPPGGGLLPDDGTRLDILLRCAL